MKQALVLFAHGSRDPQWARPLESIATRLSESFEVRLAYLEAMPPSLEDALASLVTAGASSVRVVPLFLGSGGHIKNDLPRLVAAAQAAHPGVRVQLEKPIGEERAVTDAIAAAIVNSLARPGP